MGLGGLGFGEMVLIFAVLLLLFGTKKLPELASGMGRGIRDFKRSLNGLDDTSIQASQTPNRVDAGTTPPSIPSTAAPTQPTSTVDS